jgi:ATP-dependent DNA ligase
MVDIRNEYDIDAPRAKGAYLEKLPADAIDHPDWVLEVKEDGFRMTMQIGEERSLLRGRNRKDFMKGVKKAGRFQSLRACNPGMAEIGSQRLVGTVLDGELTEILNSDGTPSKDTAEREKQGIFCGYTVWGVLFWKGYDVRHFPERYRRKLAERACVILAHPKIRIAEQVPLTMENIRMIWNRGLEGGIAKHLKKSIPASQKTMPWWYKIKTEITTDAFVSDVIEGKAGGSGVRGVAPKKNQTAASFVMSMYKNGEVVEVCKLKDLPDDVKADGYLNFGKYQFRVIEMTVSGWNGKAFRWPRFKKFREDKGALDCQFDEQIGGTHV